MSMISEQIKRLQEDIEICKRDMEIASNRQRVCKDLKDAISTIEELSAKMQASNFHNGWIRCDDRLPNVDENGESDYMLVKLEGANSKLFYELGYYNQNLDCWDCEFKTLRKVIAWQNLPEPV